MLNLRDYPGQGIPDAGVESNVEYRNHSGYPMFVCWRADDERGNSVKVLIGFPWIVSSRCNGVLLRERDAIQAAANDVYVSGASEVVLFAAVG